MCECKKREPDGAGGKLLTAVFAITAGSSVTVVGGSVGPDPVGNGQEAGDEFNLCFTLSAISH